MNHNRTTYPGPVSRILLSLCLTAYVGSALGHHPHDIIDALALSPAYSEDKTLYIANAYHLFKSGNGGRSWKELSNGLDNSTSISSIVFSPSGEDSPSLFVSTLGDGIYKSTNDGADWEKVGANLKTRDIHTLSARSDDHVLAIDATGVLHVTHNSGQTWQTAEIPEGVAITAVSPPVPFTGAGILAGDSLGRILLSTDKGGSWTIKARLPSETEITAIAFDPADTSASTYYIGTRDNGLIKTSDRGTSFTALENGLTARHIIALTFSPDFVQDHTLFVTTWREATFISSDGGDSWTRYADGLSTSKQADTAKYRSPHFRQLQTVRDDRETLFLAGFDGLFTSSNAGHSWRELETLPPGLIKALDVSSLHNGQLSVGVATYGGGAYISQDQGSSWVIGNKGLRKTRLSDIRFSPLYHEDHTLFSGSSGFLLKSTNGGSGWEQIPVQTKSLRKKIIGKLTDLGLPKDIGRKYLTLADTQSVYLTVIAPSPDYANDQTVFFGTRFHGLYRSENGGHNSHNIWKIEGAITTLAVSPHFSEDKTLFLYVRGDGIYKSTDQGDSWRRIINGLPFAAGNPAVANKNMEHKDFAIVFSPEYSQDRTLFAAGSLGLFKSMDQGESWHELKDGTLGPSPNILAMGISSAYSTDQTLLISLKGHGLYKSVDGGESFSEVGKSLRRSNHSIERIAFPNAATDSQWIYAASDEALFRSTDLGDSWTLLQRPVRYEDVRDTIHYAGNWARVDGGQYSASTAHYSETKGATASLDFFGCGIRWIASKSPQGGTADVYIDNAFIETVDLHSEQLEPVSDVFSKTRLSCQPHTISISAGEGRNGDTSVPRVSLDAFDVLPPD